MFNLSRIGYYAATLGNNIRSSREFHARLPNSREFNRLRNQAFEESGAKASWELSQKGIETVAIDREKAPLTLPKRGILKQARHTDAEFSTVYSEKNLTNLAGYEEIFSELGNLVRYLQDPKEHASKGLAAPKGVVLSGPPGVGKTFLAEAIAGHAGVPIIMVSAAELADRYVGGTEERLRKLFETANKNSPCVVCLDELEAVASKRITNQNTSNSHYINAIVGQLLSLLSKSQPGVVIVGTTNHFELLDRAVIRAGRFDKHIEVSLPNIKDRIKILQLLAKDKTLSADVSIDTLAKISSGFSGAKLEGWMKEAAQRAANRNSQSITLRDFDEARTQIEIGIVRKHVNEEMKHTTAVHECGHALIGHLLNRSVYKVSIFTHGHVAGYTEIIGDDGHNPTKQELLNQICTDLAGRAAEELFLRQAMVGSSNDLEKAKKTARYMVDAEGMGSSINGSSKDVKRILLCQKKRAQKLLKENFEVCQCLISYLETRGEILQTEFIKMMAGDSLEDLLAAGAISTGNEADVLPPLPPVKKPPSAIQKEIVPEVHSKASLPFSIREVAKAIRIDADKIREIKKKPGGYEIILKFIDIRLLKSIVSELSGNEVKNHYRCKQGETQLFIFEEKKFEVFVKRRNA